MPPRSGGAGAAAVAWRVARGVGTGAFALAFVLADVWLRGLRAVAAEPRIVLAWVASAALGLTVLAVQRGAVRVALGAGGGVVLAVQLAFAHFWHVPIDRQIAVSAVFHAHDVRPVLATMAVRIAVLLAIGVMVGGGLAKVCGLPMRAPARALLAALVIVELALGPPLRRATAEIAFADALVETVRYRRARADAGRDANARGERAHGANANANTNARAGDGDGDGDGDGASAPIITVGVTKLPNVVFVLTESVRASDGCMDDGACETMPALAATLPDRMRLREMRAVSTYTAVSLSALLTGRTQTGLRTAITGAPTLFDLVARVRSNDVRPHVAFWSSQMASVFERDDMRRNIDSFSSVEDLVGHAIADEDEVVDRGVDRLLVTRAVRDVERLPRPFFLFLQLAGTHAPYYVDPARAPFAPWSRTVSWSKLPELHAAYRNAIAAQDAALAELVQKIVTMNGSDPLLIVFTSDHGEAFGEHGAIHHGQNLYEEQLHVPAWVVSRNGALDDAAIANVRAHERKLVTHLDLLPTLLDAYGAWDTFGAREARASLPGRSLLDAPAPLAPLPITNCTSMFPCPLNAWGVLGEGATLQAQVWDPTWHCLALGSEQALPAEDAICTRLRDVSRAHYPTLPNGKENR